MAPVEATNFLCPDELERIRPGLEHLRQLRRRSFLIFMGYVPGVMLLTIASWLLTGSLIGFYVFAIAWLIAGFRASAASNKVICPRCGKPFHSSDSWHNSFTRRCLNCGLHWKADRGAA